MLGLLLPAPSRNPCLFWNRLLASGKPRGAGNELKIHLDEYRFSKNTLGNELGSGLGNGLEIR